jgi:WD40 repeat protein
MEPFQWLEECCHEPAGLTGLCWHFRCFSVLLAGFNAQSELVCLLATRHFRTAGVLCLPLQVWDLTTLQRTKTLTGHGDAVRALAVASGRLFSGSYDGTVRVWDEVREGFAMMFVRCWLRSNSDDSS